MRYWILTVLVMGIFIMCMPMNAQESKEDKLKRIAELEKEGELERKAEKQKEKTKGADVTLLILVSRDCKIIVNDKPVNYEKFQVLMEFAPQSFNTDSLTMKDGKVSDLKLRSKE